MTKSGIPRQALYNFREVHRVWTEQGNYPVLPEKEAEDFVRVVMKKLGDGSLRVGAILISNTDTILLAAYSPSDRTLQFQSDVLEDPRKILNTDKVLPAGLLLHELYHVYQASTKRGLSKARFEIDAHLFDSKSSIMAMGYDRVKEITSAQESQAAGRINEAIQEWIKIKSEGVLDAAAANFYNALSKEPGPHTRKLRVCYIDLAHYELEHRTFDNTKRRQLEAENMKDFVWRFMNFAAIRLYNEYISKQESIPEEFQKLDSPFKLPSWKTGHSASMNEGFDAFVMYLWKATEQYFLIYVIKGEADANRFLHEQYFPTLFGKSISDHLQNLEQPLD